jgi:hypothetical protein
MRRCAAAADAIGAAASFAVRLLAEHDRGRRQNGQSRAI